MTDWYQDALGAPLMNTQQMGDGSTIARDPVGHMLARFQPDGLGGGTITGQYGEVLQRVTAVGNDLHYSSPSGSLNMLQRCMGGQVRFQDAMGQSLLNHDPCTGSFTNAMGRLVMRKFSV